MSDPVGSRARLLAPEFLQELEVLRRRLTSRAPSGASGEHLAKRRGGSAEFQEHRHYTTGDDTRRIDWLAYARTGEPVIKLFRTEEDVVVRVVCDASASLGCGEPSKLEVAKRIAAAIGYMALAGSERAQLFVAGEAIEREHASVRGRGGLPAFFQALDAIEPRRGTHLTAAIDRVVARSKRAGALTVISDFFDAGPFREALRRAAAAGHDVSLVQVATADEIAPSFEGDWALEDVETGAVVDVTMDASAIEAYTLRFAGLCEELRSFARHNRAVYVRARTDEPLGDIVRRFVARDID